MKPSSTNSIVTNDWMAAIECKSNTLKVVTFKLTQRHCSLFCKFHVINWYPCTFFIIVEENMCSNLKHDYITLMA